MLYPFISWVDCDYWDYSFYLIGRFHLSLGLSHLLGFYHIYIYHLIYIYIYIYHLIYIYISSTII